jgi:hypothetical protein
MITSEERTYTPMGAMRRYIPTAHLAPDTVSPVLSSAQSISSH